MPFFGVIAIVGVVNYVRMTVDAGYGLFVQRFLNITPNAVNKRLARAKQKLKLLLSEGNELL